jgi:hypothetical protein
MVVDLSDIFPDAVTVWIRRCTFPVENRCSRQIFLRLCRRLPKISSQIKVVM